MTTIGYVTTEGGVIAAEVQPGDGYRYIGVVTPLPCEMGGGRPDSHVLVTILNPVSAAYVILATGFLADSYIVEKFLGKVASPDVYLPGVRALLAALTGREVESTDPQ